MCAGVAAKAPEIDFQAGGIGQRVIQHSARAGWQLAGVSDDKAQATAIFGYGVIKGVQVAYFDWRP